MYFILRYDYVDDVVERRGPHRAAHLELVGQYVQRGEVVLGGAFANPVDGAVIVFHADDRSTIEAFVARDPYVREGLVTSWSIREWTVVVGTALGSDS